MIQKSLTGNKARQAMANGANKVNNIVKSTLGPQGKNVVSNHLNGFLWSTKDGIKIIREITLPDPFENAGAKLLRDASTKTGDDAGDATTTTCLIATELINRANKAIKAGQSPIKIRQDIEKDVQVATKWIKDNAVKLDSTEKIKHIATISANNNEEIGQIFKDAYDQIGMDGKISLEKSKTDKTKIEVLPGYYFNQGMVNPWFITNTKKAEAELDNPLILIYDKKISKIVDIVHILKYILENNRSLLIVCAGIENEALGTVITNVREQPYLKICVVQCPEGGMKRLDMLEDMAIYTGGAVTSEDLGKQITPDFFKYEWLGEAEKVIVGKDRTVIVRGSGDESEIKARQNQIKNQLGESDNDYEKEILRNRAASIGKGVAILSIGAPTDIEKGDKYDLAEDAILAVRSAIDEGYLPGGGISYLRCGFEMDDNILSKTLFKPFSQIIDNAGEKWNRSEVNKIIASETNYGFNAKTGTYEDLVQAGVIDAAKVIRNAIENAASVASIFVSTEHIVAEFIEEPELTIWEKIKSIFK